MLRLAGFGLLFSTTALLFAAPVHAGFEFTAPPAAPRAAPAPQSAMTPDSPMPILPAAPVSAEPLPPINSPAMIAAVPQEQIYVRRPQGSRPSGSAAATAPLASEDLLDAAALGLDGGADPVVGARDPSRLVINPYPLEAQAEHKDTRDTLPVEQAMLERGGVLRPVAVPGQAGSFGLSARTSRAPREEALPAAPAEPKSGIMTPLPVGGSAAAAPIQPLPLQPATAPALAAVQASAAPVQPATGFTEAVGFGRDLPLALALSQVVPPEYSYAFASDVNVGTTVSWQGGKPWNAVLNDMLAPSGLRAYIQNNQVTIAPANG